MPPRAPRPPRGPRSVFLCVEKNKFKICVRVCVVCLLCGDVCCTMLLVVCYLAASRRRTAAVVRVM